MSLFVTFEGPEGSGKSTQVRLVAQVLREADIDVVETREPGGTPVGERIRDVLLSTSGIAINPITEAYLMTAARAQHVSDVIQPALARGAVVLCDRYIDSTLAYQGAGRGIAESQLKSIQSLATNDLTPDLTILLDLPVDVGLSRRAKSGNPLNRIDLDLREFHERVRTWYRQSAERDLRRWLLLDAEQEPGELARRIAQAIQERVLSGAFHRTGDGNDA